MNLPAVKSRLAAKHLRTLYDYDPTDRSFPTPYHHLGFRVMEETVKDLQSHRHRVSARYAIMESEVWWLDAFGIDRDYFIERLKAWEIL